MRLYFIRHGESEGNRLGIIQGWRDFPLSPLGKKQAELAGHSLSTWSFHKIYSSDLSRAHETAMAIGDYQGKEVEKLDLLREINLGPLEGKTKKEIYEQFPQAEGRSILTSGVEGTETSEAITKRCQDLLTMLESLHQDEDIALVSHGGFISIFMMYVLVGKDWSVHHRPFVIGNTSVSLIEWKKDKKPLIHFINQTAHLDFNEQKYREVQ